jgi:hypothetical protein
MPMMRQSRRHSVGMTLSLPREVSGIVFMITPGELAAADRYEVSEYTRTHVALKSGLRAWAYVRA